jgi:hypothetical protein
MAKHMVKCSICGKSFDANTEDFVKTSTTRYAHKYCAEHQEEMKSQEQKDFEQLESYTKQLFQVETLTPRFYQLVRQYVKDYQFTYKGMFQALVYFYDIKQNSVDKARGSIGIIPYCYREASDYFMLLWQARQKNETKVVKDYAPEVEEIIIPQPRRQVYKRKAFSFLDEEDED